MATWRKEASSCHITFQNEELVVNNKNFKMFLFYMQFRDKINVKKVLIRDTLIIQSEQSKIAGIDKEDTKVTNLRG